MPIEGITREMEKNDTNITCKMVFYGLIYSRLLSSWAMAEKYCKDPSKVEERAKGYVIQGYATIIFFSLLVILLNIQKIIVYFDITTSILNRFTISQFYIIIGLFAVLSYILIEIVLKKFFQKKLWDNVYKYRKFVEHPSYFRFKILDFLLYLFPGFIAVIFALL